MRELENGAYISMLRELVDEGKDVSLIISGSSMAPFLVHHRDRILFRKPGRRLRVGDMVFYQRISGQYVMHRICGVRKDGTYDLIGDAQTEIEHGITREQIFGLVYKVQRKGLWLEPKSLWWKFFARCWVRIIPLRPMAVRLFGLFRC